MFATKLRQVHSSACSNGIGVRGYRFGSWNSGVPQGPCGCNCFERCGHLPV
jgi:hypothetical protein